MSPNLPLHLRLSTSPLPLNRLGVLPSARNRQLASLQLLLDELPATDHLLLVDGRHSPGVELDVGQLLHYSCLLDQLGQLLGLGLPDHGGDDAADGGGAVELRVGEDVACESLEAFRDLWLVVLVPCGVMDLGGRGLGINVHRT